MKTLYIDYSKCIGCGTCEAVCKFIYRVPRIIMSRTTYGLHVPLYCQHCDNPKCMKACTNKALFQDPQGVVRLKEEICQQCVTKNCLMACPYVAMMCTGHENPVTKCDLCVTRADLGPACVLMCPCDALILADRESLPDLETDASKQAWQRVKKYIICPDCQNPG
ncbi:4Fe-4S dicluster domain-containing protein [Desulfonatronovibrio magnus]|uniref:4Fe-4S dicluster domain-containing protein n=1 Tax=Desulfonatronovibrio magnus TaxID=698827 RepID=UPI0005EB572A|nr:4Fe-4S dicluster domain-containing protein [Desulfonatronovibrio magnus]